ncbi:hypothetical protein, partial [Paramagnetospirillum marisnigri]|uniref:hypothetical protein n=1 Tax=Paramagnetospirillum marisnigri TaxID=1285242 RepID=UPI001C12A15F
TDPETPINRNSRPEQLSNRQNEEVSGGAHISFPRLCGGTRRLPKRTTLQHKPTSRFFTREGKA